MAASSYRKIGIASLIMMGSVFLSRVVGLLREMSVAFVGGAGVEVDAYQIAFAIPEILNHVLASGFLSVTFIPIFTRYLLRQDQREAWRVFSVIFCTFGAIAAAATGAAMAFAPELVAVAAPGVREPDVLEAAARMTRIILPAQMAFFAGGLLMAVQFAHGRFLLPALAPLIYNLGIILGGLLLGPWLGMEGFAWGVLAGALVGNLGLQIGGARRVGMRLRLAWGWRHPEVQEYLRLTLPLVVGLSMAFSTEFLFRFFGSYLPAGGIAVLNFSLRVMLILVGVFGQAVGTASFPFMARLAEAGDIAELNRLLNRTLRYLALVIPVSGLLMVLSTEVVRILFERGRFEPAATSLTAEALSCFLVGAVAFSANTVVVRGFYATRNTLTPAVFGTLAVLAGLPLYLAGLALMGVPGIALAVSVTGVLQAVVLYVIWNRRSGNQGQGEVLRFYLKMALLGLALVPILAGCRGLALALIDASGLIGSLAVALLVGAAFLALMLLAGRMLKVAEITAAAQMALRALGLGRHPAGGSGPRL
ncbi:MAG: murein biosynthesis integral membrane protein MurJ [Desulfobacterales bacterium]|jgi:putative peptidoglycan lipid II flippase|nr:murein biosynthesis integral membrane protein MurJ [Desulfobacterales bacterium]